MNALALLALIAELYDRVARQEDELNRLREQVATQPLRGSGQP